MKKTLRKDTLRGIFANKLRFLSIIVIVALGIGFFIGIKSASPSMGYSANEYFRINNLFDVQVTSRVAFSQDDIEKISKLDKVDYVVPSKYFDAMFSTGGESIVDLNGVELTCRIRPLDVEEAKLHTQGKEADDTYVNRLELKDGRYPEKPGECVMDSAAAQKYPDLKIGSVVKLHGDGENVADVLGIDALTVVGTVDSPMYISSDRGTTQVGSGSLSCFAYVDEDDFVTDEINELFVKIKYDDVYDKFTSEYKSIVNNISSQIKSMSSAIIDSKLSDLKIEYSAKIDEKQTQIDEFKKSSAEALAVKQKEIDEFKAYVDSEDEILKQEKEKSDNEKSANKTELDRFTSEFNTLNTSYNTNLKAFENQSSEIKGYSDWKRMYDERSEKLKEDKRKLDTLETAKNQAQADYNSKDAGVKNAQKLVTSAEEDVNDIKAEINNLNSQITTLDNRRNELNGNLTDLEKEIENLESKIAALEEKKSLGTITAIEELQLSGYYRQIEDSNDDVTSVKSEIKKIDETQKNKSDSIEKKNDELKKAEESLTYAKEWLKKTEQQRDTSKIALDAAKEKYDSAKEPHDKDKATLDEYADTLNQLISGEGKLVELNKTIEAQSKQLESLKIKLTNAQIKYSISVRNGDIKVQKAQYDLDKAKARYYTVDGELTALKEETDAKESELNSELKKLQNTLKNIDSITWMPTALPSLSGYAAFETSLENIVSMSEIFPVIFLVTAMIACFVIMMKNVEEERSSIGLLKAFGYSNRAIINKYVAYSLLAWLGGALLGGIFGTWIVPNAVYSIFDIVYIVPNVGVRFDTTYVLTGLVISFVTTLAATFMAVVRELRMYPAALMRPKMIGYNRRSILERLPEFWGSLPYGIVLLIRTVIRSRKRVAVGSIAIACCAALILSSFGLYNSVTDVADSQYGQDGIFKYDVQFVLNAGQNASDSAVLEKIKEDNLVNSAMLISNNSMKVSSTDDKSVTDSVKVIVPSETENLANYINLEVVSGKASLRDTGVVLSQKLAQDLNVRPGDSVNFTDSDEMVHTVRVSGVVKNYIEHYAYFSQEAYEEIFTSEPEYKYLLCSLKDYMDTQDISDFAAGYLKTEDVAGVATSEMMADAADTAIDQVVVLVVLFVLSACLLAMIVMHTTSNVNISERTHEIANIKVIGFGDGEVLLYVVRENLVSTVIGTAIGLVGGVFLHKVLINLISVESVLYGTAIAWWSFIVAALIILAVAVIASLPILFKINKVNMAETLKSVE